MTQKVRKCVIPAAGFGTRFLPATKALPKEMFPIIDKPVMQLLVEEAIGAWCKEIIIVTGKSKRAIEDHFDSNPELEQRLEEAGKTDKLEMVQDLNELANIVYVRQPYPKWDGEAILRTKNLIGNEPFLVLFWDDIVEWEKSAAQQLIEAYKRKNAPIISTVEVSKKAVSNYGILESDDQNRKTFHVDKFLEKPNSDETESRNAVIWKYVLTPDIFEYLEQAPEWKDWEIRLADGLELMRQTKDIYGLKIEWERFDTWDKLGFLKATISMALKRDDLKDDLEKYLKKIMKAWKN